MGNNCACAANSSDKKNEITAPQEQFIHNSLCQIPQTQKSTDKNIPKYLPNKQNYLQLNKKGQELEDSATSILKRSLASSRRRMSEQNRKRQQKMIQIYLQGEKKYDNVTLLQEKLKHQDVNKIQAIFKNMFLFSHMRTNEIKSIINKMKYCLAQTNEFIFLRGDPSFSLYIILKGECQVYIKDQLITVLKPGNYFGQLGVIYSAPRSASVKVTSSCLLVKLDNKDFQKIKHKINDFSEKQNFTILSKLQFYGDLNTHQKRLLAANLARESYEAGQTIFKKGDDANAFYIIREGIISIVQKKIDLKQGQTFGQNAIFNEQLSVRTCTIVAKTKCVLLSLTKKILLAALGDCLINIVKKNFVRKILKQSEIYEIYQESQWVKMFQFMEIKEIQKNEQVYKMKQTIQPKQMHIILSTDLIGQRKGQKIISNNIIKPENIYRNQKIIFDDIFYAVNNGFIAILSYQKIKNHQKDQALKEKILIKQKQVEIKQIQISSLYVIKKLGSGNLSSIYACYCIQTRKKYVTKFIAKKFINSSKLRQYAFGQQQIFKQLPPHPFIVDFYKILQSQQWYVIVLQMIEGTQFFTILQNKVIFSEIEIRQYSVQLILMFEHFYNNKIIYRDLKPQNLMINYDGFLKLVDLNTAKILKQEHNFRTSTVIGTPHYIAPQILFSKNYSFEADLWSIGVLLYEITFGYLPFGHQTDDIVEVYNQILNKRLTFSGKQNELLEDIIQRLLQKVPSRRFGGDFEQIKKHKYFSGINWSLYLQKKVSNPKIRPNVKRISLEQISKCLTPANKLDNFKVEM